MNLDTKETHSTISCKNVRFYNHYFNNGKQCPYEKNLCSLHEVSKVCKYRRKFEIGKCMLRQPIKNHLETDSEKMQVNEKSFKEVIEKNVANADQIEILMSMK